VDGRSACVKRVKSLQEAGASGGDPARSPVRGATVGAGADVGVAGADVGVAGADVGVIRAVIGVAGGGVGVRCGVQAPRTNAIIAAISMRSKP